VAELPDVWKKSIEGVNRQGELAGAQWDAVAVGEALANIAEELMTAKNHRASVPMQRAISRVLGSISTNYARNWIGAPLTAQATPNRSVNMPKDSAQNDGARGIVT
jgi:hypothetical protein